MTQVLVVKEENSQCNVKKATKATLNLNTPNLNLSLQAKKSPIVFFLKKKSYSDPNLTVRESK